MKNPQNNQQNLRKLAEEWFSRARDDELSAKDISEDRGGAASTVCFLSQQMAEKYLRGYLVFKGKRFPKVHDLDSLVRLCQVIDSGFEKIKDEAKSLTDFYVSTRYPGDYPQFSFKDCKDAFKKALKIKNFILERIELE